MSILNSISSATLQYDESVELAPLSTPLEERSSGVLCEWDATSPSDLLPPAPKEIFDTENHAYERMQNWAFNQGPCIVIASHVKR